MNTPPELTPEHRASLIELRLQCERFILRRAALVKKLATEKAIESKVAARIEKLSGNLAAAIAIEELHGRKLQAVLLDRTINETRNKLALIVQHGDETMQRVRSSVKERLLKHFAGTLPAGAEFLDPAPDSDQAEVAKSMVAVLTAILGDGEARAKAAAELAEHKRKHTGVESILARQEAVRVYRPR
jgi:hypothetical protein